MRADRLLAILLMLKNKKRVSAKELVGRLEVSERTIYRDMDALSAAGVPVYADRGPNGGFCIDPDFRIDLTGLDAEEIRDLFVNRLPGPLTELGVGLKLGTTLQKLLSSLPAPQRNAADQIHRRVHVDPVQWFRPAESFPFLKTIESAMWRNLRVDITYLRRNGEQLAGSVAPYGLVAKTSIWYLVGEWEGEIRVFRVSRFQSAVATDEIFQYPDDFDVAEYWTHWCREFEKSLPRYPVLLRLSPDSFRVLPKIFGETARHYLQQAGPPDDKGWIPITVEFETMEDACRKILGLGTLAEVLSPQELRACVMERTREILRLYFREANAPGV